MRLPKAFKGYARRYNIKTLDSRNTKIQLNNTKFYFKTKLKSLLEEMRGFEFQVTLVIAFVKELNDESKRVTNYFNSNTEV